MNNQRPDVLSASVSGWCIAQFADGGEIVNTWRLRQNLILIATPTHYSAVVRYSRRRSIT